MNRSKAMTITYEATGRPIGKDMPVNIFVVRPATTDEIEFYRWGEETLAQEPAMKVG
jgi:hypothetical protein